MGKYQFYHPTYAAVDPDQTLQDFVKLLQQNRTEIEQLCDADTPATWVGFWQPLAQLQEALGRLWEPLSTLNALVQTDAVRQAFETGVQHYTEYSTWCAHHQGIYQKTCALQAQAEVQEDAAKAAAVAHAIRDFKLAGVALPEAQKATFKELSLKLSEQTTAFSNHVLDATQAWSLLIEDEGTLAGLPETALASMAAQAAQNGQKGYRLTLDAPCYMVVMQYAKQRSLRQTLYEAYSQRASELDADGQYDNTPVIAHILALRQEKAQLLGFDDFTQWALTPRMANSETEIQTFLAGLYQASHAPAQQEFADLEAFAKAEGLDQLQPWDVGFYHQQLKQSRYAYSDEAVRPYLQLDNVLKVLFEILQGLYGVTFVQDQSVDTWHADVTYYQMMRDDQPIAGVYLDLLARQHKRGGAWMSGCVSRRRDIQGHIQLPLAQVVGNFLAPKPGQPVLLSHDDVVTLFHEFGHAMHHTLTTIEVGDVAGIHGVPWDAVELPSQLLENWAWDPQILQKMSGHYQDGQPLPDDLIQRILAARNFFSATAMLRQLLFADFDLQVHRGDQTAEPPQGVSAVVRTLQFYAG